MKDEKQLEKLVEKEVVNKSLSNLDYKTDMNSMMEYLDNFYDFLFGAMKQYTVSATSWLVGREKGDSNFEESYSSPYGNMRTSITIA